MIVAVDCDILSHWSNMGVVTYLMNLLEQFSRSESSHEFYVFVRKPPAELAALAATEPKLKLVSPWGPGWFWKLLGGAFVASPLGSGWFWKKLGSALVARRRGNILLFVPAHRVPLIPLIPKVVVIQDLGFELFPHTFRRFQRKRMSWTTRLAVRRADLVITSSESTKRDLISCYGYRPERIRVVHLGYDNRAFEPSIVSTEGSSATLKKYGLRAPFFLHVGVLQPRKNIVRLIEAFIKLMDENDLFDAQLAIVGKPGWKYKEIVQRAVAPNTKGRVILTGAVQSHELPILYKNSLALVMPSLYEGFGLPILEAMACGTPVTCSRGSSLSEIAGEAALFFDPYSVEEIANAIRNLWKEPSLRTNLIERGLQQVKHFSWQKTARETLKVFCELMPVPGLSESNLCP